jgi:hypothetical protein
LRQKTQELLYKVKTFTSKRQEDNQDIYSIYDLDPTEDKDPTKDVKKDLKEELKTFLNFLLDYITLHNKKTDLFMRTLCDDMYIAFKTFDSAKAAMFVNSRQMSQGRQQTYSVRSNFEDDSSRAVTMLMPVTMPRSVPWTVPCSFDDDDDDDDLLPPVPVFTRAQSYRPQSVLDLYDDIKYTIKQDDDSAYASIGIKKMMREVSNGPSDTDTDTGLSINLPSKF